MIPPDCPTTDLKASVAKVCDTMNKILDNPTLFAAVKVEMLRPLSGALVHAILTQCELAKRHAADPSIN